MSSPAAELQRLPRGERILLTGAGGQVGRELLATLGELGDVIAPTRMELDLLDAHSVRSAIRHIRPRWIINPAAYTAVDKAESEPEAAHAVNAAAVAVMAEEALAVGAGVLHFSTDYVFDGTKAQPYKEEDATGPQSVYGRTKLAGEQALAQSGAAHIIFRTSWVYGATGKNFLLTVLRLAREREEVKIVADQHGAPTWSRDLAKLTAHVLSQCERSAAERGGSLRTALEQRNGVYHACGAGETTWFGFAQEGIRLAQEFGGGAPYANLLPITTSEYPTPAQRPHNSRLNCDKLSEAFGWRMMDWRASVEVVMHEIAGAEALAPAT